MKAGGAPFPPRFGEERSVACAAMKWKAKPVGLMEFNVPAWAEEPCSEAESDG